MADEDAKPPGLPAGATVIGTDPLGTTVWLAASTAQWKGFKHDELNRSPEYTTAAVEQPYVIAEHPEYSDRQIYVGEDRPASDPALAPERRIIVVSTSSAPAGKMITGYDQRSSRLPAIGTVIWPPKKGR